MTRPASVFSLKAARERNDAKRQATIEAATEIEARWIQDVTATLDEAGEWNGVTKSGQVVRVTWLDAGLRTIKVEAVG